MAFHVPFLWVSPPLHPLIPPSPQPSFFSLSTPSIPPFYHHLPCNLVHSLPCYVFPAFWLLSGSNLRTTYLNVDYMWERTRVSFWACYLTQWSIFQFWRLPAMFMILFFLYNHVIVLCVIVCMTFFLFTHLLTTDHRDWSHLLAFSIRLARACAGVSEEGYRILWIYSQEWILWQSYS